MARALLSLPKQGEIRSGTAEGGLQAARSARRAVLDRIGGNSPEARPRRVSGRGAVAKERPNTSAPLATSAGRARDATGVRAPR